MKELVQVYLQNWTVVSESNQNLGLAQLIAGCLSWLWLIVVFHFFCLKIRTIRLVVETLWGLTTSFHQLSDTIDQLNNFLPTSTAPPSSSTPASGPPVAVPTQSLSASREPFMPIPEWYSGGQGSYGRFLLQYSLIFSQQPSTYTSDKFKIAFVMNLLIGKAAQWAAAVLKLLTLFVVHSPYLCQKWREFLTIPSRGKKPQLG